MQLDGYAAVIDDMAGHACDGTGIVAIRAKLKGLFMGCLIGGTLTGMNAIKTVN